MTCAPRSGGGYLEIQHKASLMREAFACATSVAKPSLAKVTLGIL